MIYRTGDVVRITCDDRAIDATVILASSNGVSLMLAFDGVVKGHVGMMPVLRGDDGQFRTLIGAWVVSIALR